MTNQTATSTWLAIHGPPQIELLLRALVFHRAVPILLTDTQGTNLDVSAGAAKLLGLPRRDVVGRGLEDFSHPAFKPVVSELWREFLQDSQQHGRLEMVDARGAALEVRYSARGDVLPGRHLLVLQNANESTMPSWVQDCAVMLLNPDGNVEAWYSGAERMYGYLRDESVGLPISHCYQGNDPEDRVAEELERASGEGHIGLECWQVRRDGSRFWASIVTMVLRDENGQPQGFARLVRDFTDRHEADEKLRYHRALVQARKQLAATAPTITGQFDQLEEADDAFLNMLGYTRREFQAGDLHWGELQPAEYYGLDDLADEETLRYGVCTPYEKELIHRDGSRIPVLISTSLLKLVPYRWITFVQDLRQPDELHDLITLEPSATPNFGEIVGGSAAIRKVQRLINVVAPTDATVLIMGETGTGKELIARAIHRLSSRADKPFVTLNCAAIPTGLLESELFGYERGAFTGALAQKIGRFEMANQGTLFLDEVGDIPLELQPKLLRALQERTFERLGGTRSIAIDVRLIAATNRNLLQMMGEKQFRSDLYYRLKVFPITSPPLRERPDDIPELAKHFTRTYSAKLGRKIEKIPEDTLRALVEYRWPGNIRELENFIERAVILSGGSVLRAPLAEIRGTGSTLGSSSLEQVERDHILRVLRENGNVVTASALALGIPRTTLNALMIKLGIHRKDL